MSDHSRIEWTDVETLAERFRGVPGHPFEPGLTFVGGLDKSVF
jgi:hypothetical protein